MDYTQLTDTELQEIFHAANEETSRRNLITAALTREPILQTGYLTALGRADGEEYVAPTGYHDAYPEGWKVTHDGKTWVSLTSANVWEPSASSPWWEEVIVGGTGPQPWAPDVYYTPPTKVTFEDNAYECTFEHLSQVGWEPNNPTMYSVWKLIQAT